MTRANIQNADRERTVHGKAAPKCTDEERGYVRDHYGRMSQAAMARELGRSPALISKLVKEMGLAGQKQPAHPEEPAVPETGDEGTLPRLKHLRRILWRNILDCDTRNLAQLSKEYRALTQEIDMIERADGGGGSSDANALDALVDAIGRKLSS